MMFEPITNEQREVIQRAIDLLSPLKRSEFIKAEFTDGSRCCVIGHFQRLTSDDPDDYKLTNCIDSGIFGSQTTLRNACLQAGVDIVGVNNGRSWSGKLDDHFIRQRKTIKGRVMNALRQIVKYAPTK